MSAPAVARQPAGTPTGGQFAAAARVEPDVELEEVVEVEDDWDFDDDMCACGASLDDGEGYDGLCGSCADAAEAEGHRGGGDDDD